MAELANKSPEMRSRLDKVSEVLFGRKTTESIQSDICVCCGNPATTFSSDLSRKEFSISGLCQTCQDEFFKE